ncbi:MAG: L,D-transpeptidase family protein [Chitinophagales bacterium]
MAGDKHNRINTLKGLFVIAGIFGLLSFSILGLNVFGNNLQKTEMGKKDANTSNYQTSSTVSKNSMTYNSLKKEVRDLAINKNTVSGINNKASEPNQSSGGDTPVTIDKTLAEVLEEKGVEANIPDLEIRVCKSAHTLTLYSGSISLKTYHCATGDSGLDDKVISGDHKTPEGVFYISEKEVFSPADYYLGSRWMRVSYPNVEDADRGLRGGLISQQIHDEIVYAINNLLTPPQDTALGGGIGIHGGTGNNGETMGDYWTYGCIGLTDHDVNEIFDYIPVGTRLVITP